MSKYYFLVFVGLLLGLYLGAVAYGLPQSFFGDELVSLAAGFSLLAAKTIRADFPFYYLPPLFSYLVAPIYGAVGLAGWLLDWFNSLADYKNFVLIYREYFLVVNRIVSAGFGLVGVWFIFLWTRRMWGKRAAGLSALLLGLDFLYLHEAQTGRFWLPATVLMIVGLYSLWRLADSGNGCWSLAATAAIGFGFGMGYVPLLLVPWWLFIELRRSKFKFDKFFYLASTLLVVLIGFFSWANPVAFKWQFGRTVTGLLGFFGYDAGLSLRAVPPSLGFWSNIHTGALALWHNNPVLFLAGLLGWWYIWRGERLTTRLLVVLFPLIYFFGFNFANGESFARYYLPIFPSLVLGAVYLIRKFFSSSEPGLWRRVVAGGLVGLIIVIDLFAAGLYLKLLHRPDTREQAIDWLYENALPGSMVVWDVDNAYLSNNRRGIEYQLKENPAGLNSRDRYLLTLPDEEFPQPNYFVIYGIGVGEPDPHLYKPLDRYYTFSYFNIEDKKLKLSRLPPNIILEAVFSPATGLKIVPDILSEPAGVRALQQINYLGPFVEIYKR